MPTRGTVEAWRALVRAGQALLAEVEEELKRAGFPSLEWYDVLRELDAEPEGTLPQAAVQARVLLAQYNLCRLVDRLEREELVHRRPSPEDGRSNLLVITGKGRELRRRMWPVYAAAIETHLGSRFDDEERAELARLLGRLTASP
ncbi:MAG: MarR family winged helix-turn-helix transcriptional regulator [Hyphomicrobiaceae bacterium]